jgi:hypothetical protein
LFSKKPAVSIFRIEGKIEAAVSSLVNACHITWLHNPGSNQETVKFACSRTIQKLLYLHVLSKVTKVQNITKLVI